MAKISIFNPNFDFWQTKYLFKFRSKGNYFKLWYKVGIDIEWLRDEQIFIEFKNESEILNVRNWKIKHVQEDTHSCIHGPFLKGISKRSNEIGISSPNCKKRKIFPKRVLVNMGPENSGPLDLSDDTTGLISIRFVRNKARVENIVTSQNGRLF